MFQTLVTIEHLTGMTALCNGTLKSEVSEGLGFSIVSVGNTIYICKALGASELQGFWQNTDRFVMIRD